MRGRLAFAKFRAIVLSHFFNAILSVTTFVDLWIAHFVLLHMNRIKLTRASVGRGIYTAALTHQREPFQPTMNNAFGVPVKTKVFLFGATCGSKTCWGNLARIHLSGSP